MKIIEQSIEVDVPVRTAYNQWTQFEEFPLFMAGVETVRQIDDTHSTGRRASEVSNGNGTPKSRNRHPTSGLPGPPPTGPEMPESSPSTGWTEKLGIIESQVEADMARFKEMIEGRHGDRCLAG